MQRNGISSSILPLDLEMRSSSFNLHESLANQKASNILECNSSRSREEAFFNLLFFCHCRAIRINVYTVYTFFPKLQIFFTFCFTKKTTVVCRDGGVQSDCKCRDYGLDCNKLFPSNSHFIYFITSVVISHKSGYEVIIGSEFHLW